IARWLKDLESEFVPFDGLVGDPAGLATMVITTLGDEHQVYVEPAEKREKNDHIEVMNNDFDRGLIHVRAGSELSEELLGNRWLEKTVGTDKRKEDPATPNDVADAALYAFRWCRHRGAKAEVQGPKYGSTEWLREQMAAELRALEDAARE